MIRPFIHIVLHFIVPGFIARWFFYDRWKWAWFMMLLTLIIDLDHFLADPIYDPNRCSIGFHPFHSYPAIGIYFALILISRLRIVGLGLVIHMVLDGIDCLWIKWPL